MKLPISQILTDSFDDLFILIKKPALWIFSIIVLAVMLGTMIILYLIYGAILPLLTNNPALTMLTLIIFLILFLSSALFIYAYFIKLLHNLKNGDKSKILPEMLKIYPDVSGISFILASPIILFLILKFMISPSFFHIGETQKYTIDDPTLYLMFFGGTIIFILVAWYLFIRLGFFIYLMVIERDKKPFKTSWVITRGRFWSLLLLFFLASLLTLISIGTIEGVISSILTKLHINDTIITIVELPFDIVMDVFIILVTLNAFLFLRPQPKLQPVAVEEPPIN